MPLTAAERRAVDDMLALAGLGNDADLGRLALWRLAEWYRLDLPLARFAIGGPLRRARRPDRAPAADPPGQEPAGATNGDARDVSPIVPGGLAQAPEAAPEAPIPVPPRARAARARGRVP